MVRKGKKRKTEGTRKLQKKIISPTYRLDKIDYRKLSVKLEQYFWSKTCLQKKGKKYIIVKTFFASLRIKKKKKLYRLYII